MIHVDEDLAQHVVSHGWITAVMHRIRGGASCSAQQMRMALWHAGAVEQQLGRTYERLGRAKARAAQATALVARIVALLDALDMAPGEPCASCGRVPEHFDGRHKDGCELAQLREDARAFLQADAPGPKPLPSAGD